MDYSKMTQQQLKEAQSQIEYYMTSKKKKEVVDSNLGQLYALLVKFLEEEHGLSYPALGILKKSDSKLHTQIIKTLENYRTWSNQLFLGNSKTLKIKETQFLNLAILFISTSITLYLQEMGVPMSLKALVGLKSTTFQEIIGEQFPGYSRAFLATIIVRTLQGSSAKKFKIKKFKNMW